MRYFKFCIIITLTLLELINFNGVQTTACWTADNENGFCIPITNCERINWLLTNPNPYIVDFVRRSHCGIYGNIQYVCCSMRYNSRNPTVQHYSPQKQQQEAAVQHYSQIHYYPLHQAQQYSQQRRQQYTNTQQYPTTTQFYNSWSRPENFRYPPHYTEQHQNAIPYAPNTHTHTHTQNINHQPWISVGERILNAMPCGAVNGDRIANGEKVQLSEYPWMALLEFSDTLSVNRFLCGGSLITDRYVLTAAHCVSHRNNLISIRLGEQNLGARNDCVLGSQNQQHCAPPVEDIGIEQIIPHPEYSARSLMHDIALIRLNRNVQFQDHIKPICLPRTQQMLNYMPTRVIISGWGITERGYASDELMKAEIPVRENSFCQNIYQRNMITSNQICAGGELRKSTCRGDSGSPMFAAVNLGWHKIHYLQFGIVSAGDPSCGSHHNYPSVYTRISPYIEWITSILQP